MYPVGSNTHGALSQPAAPPPAEDPIFQVRVAKHVGALVFWYNQSRIVTGTYAQCDAAITQAQQHNLLLGWWSLASILVWNPISLWRNIAARKALCQQAEQARQYAQWWAATYGVGARRAPGWAAPPQQGWAAR